MPSSHPFAADTTTLSHTHHSLTPISPNPYYQPTTHSHPTHPFQFRTHSGFPPTPSFCREQAEKIRPSHPSSPFPASGQQKCSFRKKKKEKKSLVTGEGRRVKAKSKRERESSTTCILGSAGQKKVRKTWHRSRRRRLYERTSLVPAREEDRGRRTGFDQRLPKNEEK